MKIVLMKKYSLILIFITLAIQGNAQSYLPWTLPFSVQDSLKKIAGTEDQRIKAIVYSNMGTYYSRARGDSAMLYLSKAEKIAKEKNYSDLLPKIYFNMGSVNLFLTGNYPLGLYHGFEQLKYSELMQDRPKISGENVYSRNIYTAYLNIAISYAYLGNKEKAKEYMNKIPQDIYIAEKWDEFLKYGNQSNILWDDTSIFSFSNYLVRYYITINNYEKAKLFLCRAREINLKFSAENQNPAPYRVLKAILMTNDKMYDSAGYYYKLGIDIAIETKDYKFLLESNLGVANAFKNLGAIDSAIFYSKNVINLSDKFNNTEAILNANILLYKTHKQIGDSSSAFKYLEAADLLKDQLFNNAKANEAQNIALNEEVKQRELKEQKAEQQKFLMLTSIAFILLVVGIYLNGKRKEKERIRQIEDERKNKELKAASDLQQSLLPKENPKRSDLDIATFIRSSTEVGGDYYDFFPQKDGSLFSVCGDATGHGVTSGMMVSVTKAALNGINPVKPNKILQRLNNVVKRIDLGTLRMSLNIAEITQNEVCLSSAAMPPIYLYKNSSNTVEELMQSGLPLGGLKDETFDQLIRSFESGDVLIQLSDGLPEAPNAKGELYDYDRLKSLIQASGHLSAQQIIDVLIESVDQWLEGLRNPDDITLVVIKKMNP
jgi:sigma-B regulation protein RsbU (phosphoserine phosphatase)